jgi:hypothetical protein
VVEGRWQTGPLIVEMMRPGTEPDGQADSSTTETPAGASGEPGAGGDEQPVESDEGMTSQEAAERMNRLRAQGEPWTSQHEMAKRLGCSSATINKAIRNTPELRPWAKRRSAPKVKDLNETVIDRKNLAQNCEPDPQDDAAEAELRMLFENAGPDERGFLNSISGAPRDYQLWYIQQPAEDRRRHRNAWKKRVEPDPTTKAWFLELALDEKLAFLNDPGEHQKTFHVS